MAGSGNPQASEAHVISIAGLRKVYAGKSGGRKGADAGASFEALKGIDLDIRRGEIFALLARIMHQGQPLPAIV